MEKRQDLRTRSIATVAGIGCSSRFPYFVQANGAHFIHGRALPFASGISLTRPDLHVFVFGGDGDAFSIGGNHLNHTARKNIKMTYVVMDNWVYGLTKKQTSPTSPLGFKSKTDIWGAVDQPINPMKQLIAAGATLCRPRHPHQSQSSAANDGSGHGPRRLQRHRMPERMRRVLRRGVRRLQSRAKAAHFNLVPADHDVTDEVAAYKLADAPFPGYFGIFYKSDRPTKNKLEADINAAAQQESGRQKGLANPARDFQPAEIKPEVAYQVKQARKAMGKK